MNRLRAGEALVRNPMQKNQVSRILLTPETVDAFVFWKKNPTSFLHCLPEIQALGYPFYFLFTLTPYPLPLTMQRWSQVYRKQRRGWRYSGGCRS